MSGETWKDIKGFDIYEISNFGNVRNKNTLKILKKFDPHNTGACVRLLNRGKRYQLNVAKLVAEAFIPKVEGDNDYVIRKNGNTRDDSAKNLEWAHGDNCLFVSGRRVDDLTGKKFGMLTALNYELHDDNHWRWRCKCDCGNITYAFGYELKKLTRVSCGCYKKTEEYRQRHGICCNQYRTYHETLCLTCEHATNKKNLCPWVGLDRHGNIKWQHVDGWTTESIIICGIGETKRVISCPLYKEG